MFLDKGLVKKLIVDYDWVKVELDREVVNFVYFGFIVGKFGFYYYFIIGFIDVFERRLDEVQQELGILILDRILVLYVFESNFSNLLIVFGLMLMIMGLLIWLVRWVGVGMGGGGSGVFGFGKSKVKEFNYDVVVKVKFVDVVGMDEVKMEIMEFVSFLKLLEWFQRLGVKILRGVILFGLFGIGKMFLVKVMVGEFQVLFYFVSGFEFVEMFVGVGVLRVWDLFLIVRKNVFCIVFIDEIDVVGKFCLEGGGFRGGGNDEWELMLNQILIEMDGFNILEQVVVLVGMNRFDIFDKVLMCFGCFDRYIYIDWLMMKGCQEIFKVYFKKILMNEDLIYLIGWLVVLIFGFVGVDIVNVVNEVVFIGMFFFIFLFYCKVQC